MPGDKLRCNQCGRLFVQRHVLGVEGCRCGCKVWVSSRVTIPERIGYWIGYNKDAGTAVTMMNRPVGGRADSLTQHWPGEQQNGNSTS